MKVLKKGEKMRTIAISLGGSVMVPNEIDTKFLAGFKKLVISFLKKNYRFIIVTGGGKTARNYMHAARKLGKLTNEDIDWLGIHATRINGHLLRTIFRKYAHPVVIKNPLKKVFAKEKIIIGAGYKPGVSSDWDTVMLAKNLGATEILNITNVDYVYDKDPRKFKNAKKIEEMSWSEYRKMIGSVFKGGENYPFDPIASREAQKAGIRVCILGKELKNLRNYLSGKKFRGTIIG